MIIRNQALFFLLCLLCSPLAAMDTASSSGAASAEQLLKDLNKSRSDAKSNKLKPWDPIYRETDPVQNLDFYNDKREMTVDQEALLFKNLAAGSNSIRNFLEKLPAPCPIVRLLPDDKTTLLAQLFSGHEHFELEWKLEVLSALQLLLRIPRATIPEATQLNALEYLTNQFCCMLTTITKNGLHLPYIDTVQTCSTDLVDYLNNGLKLSGENATRMRTKADQLSRKLEEYRTFLFNQINLTKQ